MFEPPQRVRAAHPTKPECKKKRHPKVPFDLVLLYFAEAI
jgi:hypothetical protein